MPRGHACDNARRASIADAGAAGYSVTVAHPAASPTASAQHKSRRALWLSRKRNADNQAPARPLASVRRTPQTRHRRQRRDRPRTRRLVLVAGRARRLTASSLRPIPGFLRSSAAAGPVSRSVLLAALRGLHLDPRRCTATAPARNPRNAADGGEDVRSIQHVGDGSA